MVARPPCRDSRRHDFQRFDRDRGFRAPGDLGTRGSGRRYSPLKDRHHSWNTDRRQEHAGGPLQACKQSAQPSTVLCKPFNFMHALHWLSAGRSALVSGMGTTTALLI